MSQMKILLWDTTGNKISQKFESGGHSYFFDFGGGSALFENPLISSEEFKGFNESIIKLWCGYCRNEYNQKKISAVKGGKFAKICKPAKVYAVVLSDILGDPLDMIASGPACSDSSTCEQALEIIDKYHISISEKILQLLKIETPKFLNNVENSSYWQCKRIMYCSSKNL